MNLLIKKNLNKEFRKNRNRARISGTPEKPRLSVFVSNRHIYVQLIDDESGKTLASVSTHELKGGKMKRTKQAEELGKMLVEKAKKAGVKNAVLNRGIYKYHGRIKALTEGARNAGLKI